MRILPAVLVAALVACATSPVGPRTSIAGTWLRFPPPEMPLLASFHMVLTESGDAIRGSADWDGGPAGQMFSVTGRYVGQNVTLTFSSAADSSLQLVGETVNNTTMVLGGITYHKQD